MYGERLIILRGNSGSGKTTVAKKLRDASQKKIAIVEQDYLRRIVLKEKEVENGNNIDLIRQTVEFALEKQFNVILEGILDASRYGQMVKELLIKAQTIFSTTSIFHLMSLSKDTKRNQTLTSLVKPK